MFMKYKDLLVRLAVTAIVLIFMCTFSINAQTAETTAVSQQGGLDEIQRNSISMLNYLTVLTQQINTSKNSRIYLEEAYSLLINNIAPNAVDARTLEHLVGILDTLENYRMIEVKRERLKYYHEQERAQSIRSIVPNPIGILSIIESGSLPKIALSIASTAFDSAVRYITQIEEANLQLIIDGWALDDEESAVLHNSRKSAFNYMVNIVNELKLPGELALNESYVDSFVANKNNSNVVQRIQFLETNREAYQAFGDYWLVLAESYYNHGDYQNCLKAMSEYEKLNIHIFRRDYDFARILPLAIAAAKEIKSSEEYIEFAAESSKKILNNIDIVDWILRYFVAHTYIDLFDKTNDSSYLRMAYSLALDNVNSLVNLQKVQNREYIAEVATATVPKGASKEEKTEIEHYNKFLKEERKSTAPPVYEPLLLNCDLLFMLADELNVEDSEKAKIDNILHENGENIFLIPAIDSKYWLSQSTATDGKEEIDVIFTGKELSIPVECVSDDSLIKVAVLDPDSDTPAVFEDWALLRVERKNKGNIETFTAVFQSPSVQNHKYIEGATVDIEVLPKNGILTNTFRFRFTAEQKKSEWWEVVKVWEDNITFNRTSL